MARTIKLNDLDNLDSTQLLKYLHEIHINFIQQNMSFEDLFDILLDVLLQITKSKSGFIGRVLYKKGGEKYLKIFAISDQDKTNDKTLINGLEFHNLNSLFGWVIKNEHPLITNDAHNHPEYNSTPVDHPTIEKYMGIPIKFNGEMIGLVSIANREVGYSEKLLSKLEPFISSCSTLIQNRIIQDKHLDVEAKLKHFKIALDASAIVAITNPKGKITYVNDKFIEISKFSREELIGKDHRIINSGYHPKEFFTDLWNTLSKGKVWKGEIKNEAKDGKHYWVYSTIVPFLDKNKKPYEYLAIRYDITKQKLIEEKLEKQNVELDQFASIVSHDLKAPLRGIGTMVQFLEEDLPELNEDSKENLNLLKSRIVRLNSFIEGLLEYSKIGSKQEVLTQIDVDKVLRTTIDNLFFSSNVRINIKNKMPILKSNSALLFEQLFSNIIGNSVKHSDKEEVQITIECKTKKHYYEFRIADNGPGISPHLRDRVFKIFQTLKTKDETNSTGLGLAIVKKIVGELNGSITIEDNNPSGVIFVFTHPK